MRFRTRGAKNTIRTSRAAGLQSLRTRKRFGYGIASLLPFVALGLLGIMPLIQSPAAQAATCSPTTNFISTWSTNPSRVTTIYTTAGYSYNYSVDWNNDGIMDETGLTGDKSHTFPETGNHTIQICGTFPSIAGNKFSLKNVSQWGDNPWLTMKDAFKYYSDLTFTATDTPNLSNVTDMSGMFKGSTTFNSPIGSWDVSHVTDMSHMFDEADGFNQPLNSWNVSNVTDMSWMFYSIYPDDSLFNQPLNNWNVGNVTNMSHMFYDAGAFNQPLNSWNVSNVTDMSFMFSDANKFNQPLNNWDVRNVTTMASMFSSADKFNGAIGTWNTGKVTDMSWMLFGTPAFDQPLTGWNTASVTDMRYMFASPPDKPGIFNRPIENWDVSKVVNMSYMFANAVNFNQPLNGWNVGKVEDMSLMFNNAASFNQPLPDWNISSVTKFYMMFYDAKKFNQSLGNWTFSASVDRAGQGMSNILPTTLSKQNYEATLVGWAANPQPNGLLLVSSGLTYCAAEPARQQLITDKGWTIYSDARECPEVTSATTSSAGGSRVVNLSGVDFGNISSLWMRPSMVSLDGQALPVCGSIITSIMGMSVQSIIDTYGPMYGTNASHISDSKPCYSLNASATIVSIQVPDNFDTGVDHTYAVNGSAPFTWRQTPPTIQSVEPYAPTIEGMGYIINGTDFGDTSSEWQTQHLASLNGQPLGYCASTFGMTAAEVVSYYSLSDSSLVSDTAPCVQSMGSSTSLLLVVPTSYPVSTPSMLVVNGSAPYQWAVAPPQIQSIEFAQNDGHQSLLVNGTGFTSGPYGFYDALSRSLVSLNGAPLGFCADNLGSDMTAQQVVDQVGQYYGTTLNEVSDTPPCYEMMDQDENPLITPTQAVIRLAPNFDTQAPGSVTVNGSNTYWFNTGDTIPEEPVVSPTVTVNGNKPIEQQPVVPVRPTFSGKAQPGATVTVTVRSDPVICVATADSNGNWSCTLPTNLPAGTHSVNVVFENPDSSTSQLGTYTVLVDDSGTATPPVITDTTPRLPDTSNLQAPDTGIMATTKTLLVGPALIILALGLIMTPVIIRAIKR